MSVYKGGSLCFHRFKRVRRSGKETLNSYGVTVGFGSSSSANQTDLSKRMLCLEDDSWATDILFLSESDAFSRQPMMEAFWATTRKLRKISLYTPKRKYWTNRYAQGNPSWPHWIYFKWCSNGSCTIIYNEPETSALIYHSHKEG